MFKPVLCRGTQRFLAVEMFILKYVLKALDYSVKTSQGRLKVRVDLFSGICDTLDQTRCTFYQNYKKIYRKKTANI